MLKPLLIVLSLAVQAAGQGYVCAEGGGNAGKGVWADEVFGWMVEKGNRGKVVIIGAVPIEGEDSRVALFKKLGAAEVVPLVVTKETADTQETYDAIAAASVVFIRGGAQSRYVEWWKGTKTQAAIEAVFKKGGVIAGTSAGCAVLGEVDYDAKTGSLSAREALADGRHENLTLTTGFLDFVPGVLFDTHFTERGRLARLPVMLAHCKEDLKKPDILGIGVDPRTAVCVGPDGIAEIRGEGTVTFLRLTPESKIAIEKGKPPTVTHISYMQTCAGYRYDLAKREVVGRPAEVSQISHAAMITWHTKDGATIHGSVAEDSAIGGQRVTETKTDAWLSGGPGLGTSNGALPYAFVATRAFESPGVANNLAGFQIVMAIVRVLLDEGCVAGVSPNGAIRVEGESERASSLLLLDARQIGRMSVPTEPRKLGRDARACEGAAMSLLAPGWTIELDTSRVTGP